MISPGFFVPGWRSFARTGMPRFVREGEPDVRRVSRCACSACATCRAWPTGSLLYLNGPLFQPDGASF